MVHTLAVVEPICPMLENTSKTLMYNVHDVHVDSYKIIVELLLNSLITFLAVFHWQATIMGPVSIVRVLLYMCM